MAFWHKREKRIALKKANKAKKAKKKAAKAATAAANGNLNRAAKLNRQAADLQARSDSIVIYNRVTINGLAYQANEEEIEALKSAIDSARLWAKGTAQFLTGFNGKNAAGKIAFWNNDVALVETFGANPSEKDVDKLLTRCAKVIDILCNRTIFLDLDDAKKNYAGRAAPGVFNRPVSKNFRFKIWVKNNYGNISGVRKISVGSLTDTIVHEICHSFSYTDDNNNNATSVTQKLRVAAIVAKFFFLKRAI